MPAISLGTAFIDPEQVASVVEDALRAGYRHFDTAWLYKSEAGVGQAIRNSGVPRSELFITTKLWNTFHRPEDVKKGLEESLANLGLDYVDMYLMHGPLSVDNPPGIARDGPTTPTPYEGIPDCDPQIDVIDTYRAMEKLLETGKVKAIGVSNFSVDRLERLLANTSIIPAVNQVELHPYLPQPKLVEYCQSKGIALTAYAPLGSIIKDHLREDPVVVEVAKSCNVTSAQVLLGWGLKRGYGVIPKSKTKERIIENFHPVDLTDEDFAKISAITYRERFINPGDFIGKAYTGAFGFEEA
ncbi:hypothetical protein FBU59_003330 [Linderina macrospora]|uniref:Uncharacterized protein n=1 Tax=Linderina macrospora TaxID=4868 RepID=A0ACC1J8X2_9FUNG|nr:hypothetical protein FBU59_003330 [Linderina macrospora]